MINKWSEYGPWGIPTIIVLFAGSLSLCPAFDEGIKTAALNEPNYQVTLLALVVAFAAYIGNVQRDIIKKISEHNSNSSPKAAKRKEDLRWLIGLDALLVILGLVIIIQLLFPKTWELVVFTVKVKTVMFPLLLLYVAGLHLRQWRKT